MSPAEALLQELGITDPQEIDLEAIAWHVGVRIKICDLDGCEARITGHGKRAIVRVNRSSHRRRRRFSIGHELGHWRYHRGRLLVCRPEDIGNRTLGPVAIERVADAYAADLLMPRYLFDPIAREYSRLDFHVVREISHIFQTSRPATAIRLVEGKHSRALLICHGTNGRKWFTRSPDVSSRWFPRKDLDAESFAFDTLFGNGPEQTRPRIIGADAWFDRHDAHRYEILEQSIRTNVDEILTLLLITDDGMLSY